MPRPVLAFRARELARVAPARSSPVLLMKIDISSDLAFLRGCRWTRTTGLSLVRRVTRVAGCRWPWPGVLSGRTDHGCVWLDVAWCQWSLALGLALSREPPATPSS